MALRRYPLERARSRARARAHTHTHTPARAHTVLCSDPARLLMNKAGAAGRAAARGDGDHLSHAESEPEGIWEG